MATEMIGSSGQETMFKQLANYNWDKDKEYQGGLSAILGPSPLPSQIYDLTLRAQCFYMSRKKGITVDFDAYKAYLSSNPTNSIIASTSTSTSASHKTTNASSKSPAESSLSSPAPQTQDSSMTQSNSNTPQLQGLSLDDTMQIPAVPLHQEQEQEQDPIFTSNTSSESHPPLTGAWQNPTYTPPAPLFSDRTPPKALTSHDLLSASSLPLPPAAPIQTTYADPSTAPYPASFPEIIALIQSGAPIPGIKDISQETLWGQGGEQTMRARRKPWEMHLTEEEVQVGFVKVFGDRRDEFVVQDLPDEEEGGGKGRMPPPKPVPDWRGLKKVEERVPDWQLAMTEKK